MIDLNAERFTRKGIHRTGVQVTFQRVSGLAPNTTTQSATVKAKVSNFQPDGVAESQSGRSGSEIGAISLLDRQIHVMASDLAAQNFPLPLKKGDNALVAATGEKLKILRVDSTKRALSGCIEAYGVTA